MKTFYSQKGERLSKEILTFYGAEINYSVCMKLLRKKDVKLNGKRVSSDLKTEVGDEICVYYDAPKREIRVLFGCDDLLAVYKPKGVTSEDFFRLVKAEYPSAIFTHRLDRNTDGIMLFALNDAAHCELFDGFKKRTFDKYYVATVFGEMPKNKERLVAYLKKDADLAEVKISAVPKAGFEEIITEYEVLSREGELSVLKVKLVTGKTHQIRAHLAFVGHPIIGDGKYGDNAINKRFNEKYQMLTACELRFISQRLLPFTI